MSKKYTFPNLQEHGSTKIQSFKHHWGNIFSLAPFIAENVFAFRRRLALLLNNYQLVSFDVFWHQSPYWFLHMFEGYMSKSLTPKNLQSKSPTINNTRINKTSSLSNLLEEKVVPKKLTAYLTSNMKNNRGLSVISLQLQNMWFCWRAWYYVDLRRRTMIFRWSNVSTVLTNLHVSNSPWINERHNSRILWKT